MKPSIDEYLVPFSNHPYREELVVALNASLRAGSIIEKRWDTPMSIEMKGEIDVVSEVDIAAEKAVLDTLTNAYPNDRIIAEESGGQGESGGREWHIDPLDGTTNFTHGFPQFCTSIVLAHNHRPVVGVVHDPIRNWTFYGAEGGGAYRNTHRLKVSQRTTLGASLIATGFPYDRWTAKKNNSHRFSHLLRRTQGLRRAGAAALDLAFVAAGWLDGYWERSLSSWDIGAGILLVREAGGCVTTYSAVPASIESQTIIATNGIIHDELVKAVASAPELIEAPTA